MNFKILGFLIFLSCFSAHAVSNQNLVYQGRILKPDGQPVNAGNIQFTIQVYSPAPDSCLLWEEKQSLNMGGSMGAFNLELGHGTNRTGGVATFSNLFTNAGTISGLTCGSGATAYSPTATDERTLAVSFNDNGTLVNLAAMPIKSVPYALQASQIGGYGIGNLVRLSGTSSTNLDPLQLEQLAKFPTVNCATGEVLKWSGAAWACAVDVGGAIGDATYASKGIVQLDTNLATSGLTVAGGVLSMPAVGTAGTYGSASQVPVLTTDAKGRVSSVVNTAIAINPNQINQAAATSGQVLKWNGAAWAPAADDVGSTTLTGDVTGTLTTTSVDRIKGTDVTITALTSGNFLRYNGTAWVNTNLVAADVPAVDSAKITDGTIVDADVNAAAAIARTKLASGTADHVLINNGSGVMSSEANLAISRGGTGAGSFAANKLIASNGTGTALQAITTCTVGQVLKFDASGNWTCGTDNDSTPGDASYAAKGIVQFDTNVATSGINVAAGVASLPAVGTAGTYGSASQVPVLTTDAKGRVSGVTNTAIAINPNQINQAAATSGQALKWNGTAWAPAADDATDATKLPLAGGTMSGSINMGGFNITNAGNIELASSKHLLLGQYAADPSTAGWTAAEKGRTWFNTTSNQVKYWDGSAVQALGVSGAGLTSLGGQTNSTQTFAAGSAGNSPAIASAANVHTLNVPLASAGASVTSGTISNTDYVAFNAKLGTATAFSGDVSGTYNATSVDKIKGTDVTITAIASGNFLRYNGSAWVNANLVAGDIPAVDSAKITDGTIVDADVNASAAIARTKLASGTADHVLINNGSGVMSSEANLAVSRGGTGAGSFSANKLIASNGTGTALQAITTCTVGQVLKFDASGNWTCGTDLGSPTAFVQDGNSFAGLATLGTNDANDLAFETGGVEKMRILSSGLVGVGTNNPTAPLTVYANNPAEATGQFRIQQDGTGDSLIQLMLGATSGYAFGVDNSDNDKLKIGASSSGYPGVGTSTIMAWDKSNGNVGIGSDAPGYRLDVVGDINITGSFRINGTPIGGGAGTVTSVTSANADIGVTPTTTTPVLTLNSGVGANQILKLDGSSRIPAVNGSLITNLDAGNISAGVLPINRGGTNNGSLGVTAGGMLYADGTKLMTTAAGTSGQAMISAGAGAPAFGTLGAAGGGTGQAGGYTAGDLLYASGASALSKLAIGASGTILTSTGSAPTWSASLAVTQGGTGATSFSANKLIASNGTGAALQAITTCTLNQVLKFDASGNWTCGTDIGSATGFVQDGNSFTATATLGTNDAYDLAFETGGTEKMRILSGGNVGIGTNNPTAPLTMYSNNAGAATGQIRVQQDGTGDSLIQLMLGATSGYAFGVDNSDGDKLKIGSSSSGYPGVDAGTIMTWDKTGRYVGIGSDAPAGILDVQGGFAAASTNATHINIVAQGGGSGNTNGGDVKIASGQGFGTGSRGSIYMDRSIYVRPTTGTGHGFMMLDANDADTSGGADLRFNAMRTGGAFPTAATIMGHIIFQSVGTQWNESAMIKAQATETHGANNSGGSLQFATTPNGTNSALTRMSIDQNGKIGINQSAGTEFLEVTGNVKATAFISTSDARLKTDIEKVIGLDFIRSLNGYSYRWKSDGRADYGVLAQEVEKVMPAAVTTDPVTGLKAVKYNNLIAPLIESVKEMDRRVASLENKAGSGLSSSSDSPLAFNTSLGSSMVWANDGTNLSANIYNMKPGSSYMLVVSGEGTGPVAINCYADAGMTALPSSFVPANSSRKAGALNKTMYTLVSDGTNCLITWVSGF